jgi:hypothetical protein
MNEDFDRRLREGLSQLPLPDAPQSLRDAIDRLDDEPVRPSHRMAGILMGWPATAVFVAAVALVTLIVVAGPLGMAGPGPTSSEPTSPTSGLESQSAPPVATVPVIVCGRLDPDPCHAAIELVRQADPKRVEAATAIVVDDVCAPTVLCDRLYPFDALVVLVASSGGPTESHVYQVVGLDYQPERVEAWAGPVPAHITALVQGVTTAACTESAPTTSGGWWVEVGGPHAYFNVEPGTLYATDNPWKIIVRFDPDATTGETVAMAAEAVPSGQRVEGTLNSRMNPANIYHFASPAPGLPGGWYLFEQRIPTVGCWRLSASIDGRIVGTATLSIVHGAPSPEASASARPPASQVPSPTTFSFDVENHASIGVVVSVASDTAATLPGFEPGQRGTISIGLRNPQNGISVEIQGTECRLLATAMYPTPSPFTLLVEDGAQAGSIQLSTRAGRSSTPIPLPSNALVGCGG